MAKGIFGQGGHTQVKQLTVVGEEGDSGGVPVKQGGTCPVSKVSSS